LKQTTACEFLHSRFRGSVRQIILLLLPLVAEQLVGSNVVGEFSESVVVACSKATLDEVSLFVGVVVEHWVRKRYAESGWATRSA
jgi:hypothetical protein